MFVICWGRSIIVANNLVLVIRLLDSLFTDYAGTEVSFPVTEIRPISFTHLRKNALLIHEKSVLSGLRLQNSSSFMDDLHCAADLEDNLVT
jgi:predicted lysophospholipase L1 biosynthesis ABC-type transport system permease subunit